MSHPSSLVRACALAILFSALSIRSASCITFGGWTTARGGDSGILTGGELAATRSDLSTYFPGTTLAQTGTLTSTFLNSIDVLIISPVFGGGSVTTAPLSTSEQSALTTWISGGGRALIVGENQAYYTASQSMISPFGPQWADATLDGFFDATITDRSSFPDITNGPFGIVGDFTGDFASYFADVGPATPLGEWGFSFDSLAAMEFGAGKVVFFGDNLLLFGADAGYNPNNDLLRRNTLAFLIPAVAGSPYDYNANGAVDAADYALWRKTFGQTGSGLAADGNGNNAIDPGDYNLWRAHFGDTNAGSGAATTLSAIPEPTSLVLVSFAIATAALLRRVRS